MPKFEWKKGTAGDNVTFEITVDQTPTSVTKWSAVSDTPDFRKSKWTPEKVESSTKITAGIPPTDKYRATLFEYEFETGKLHYTLTTQIGITAPKK